MSPKKHFQEFESIKKKKCFKQTVADPCKTEEYDYNQPAIKIR